MSTVPFDEANVLAVDLDGTVCTINPDYSLCEPIDGSVDALRVLRAEGFLVYLHTGRHINQAAVTKNWLAKHDVPYDLLVFGKPPARFYIDDRAIEFSGWDEVLRRCGVRQ